MRFEIDDWRLSPADSRWLHGGLFILGAAIVVGVPVLLETTCGDTLGKWIERLPLTGNRFPF